MTINSAQVSVSTTAVLLADGSNNGVTVTVNNTTGPTVYLGGGTTVAGTTGYGLAGTAAWGPQFIEAGDTLYGITSAGTATVHVLRSGV